MTAIAALSELTRLERIPKSMGMPNGATAPPNRVTMYLNRSLGRGVGQAESHEDRQAAHHDRHPAAGDDQFLFAGVRPEQAAVDVVGQHAGADVEVAAQVAHRGREHGGDDQPQHAHRQQERAQPRIDFLVDQ